MLDSVMFCSVISKCSVLLSKCSVLFFNLGANCGIGFEAAKYLIEGGNEVVLACRNEQKAKEAIESIKRDNPRGKAVFLQVTVAIETIKGYVSTGEQ